MVTIVTRLWLTYFVLVTIIFLLNTWSISDQKPPEPRSFRVDPHPTIPMVVQIIIDVSNVPRNFYFESVIAVIGFYDSNKQQLSTQTVHLYDRMRGGEIYQVNWSYTPIGSAVWMRGERVQWSAAGVTGGKFDIPPQSIEASSEFIRIPHQ